jgi:mxaK protein
MRRAGPIMLCLWVLAALAATGWFGLRAWQQHRDNAAIRSLAAGRDVVPAPGADARVAQARALYMAWRDRIPEAEAQGPALLSAPALLRGEFHYAIANARLRVGLDALAVNRLDDATAQINLAKAAYRQALQARPDYFDAKVNLDLAMRLVRDLPREGQDGEDADIRPERLWTDLPGLPRGAP